MEDKAYVVRVNRVGLTISKPIYKGIYAQCKLKIGSDKDLKVLDDSEYEFYLQDGQIEGSL